MIYRYYISTDGGSNYTEVFPVDPVPEFTQKHEVGSDLRNCYRWEWPKLRITRNDNASLYTTMSAWFIDDTKFITKIIIKRYRGNNITGTLINTGYFSVTDIEPDLSLNFFDITPINEDSYNIFDELSGVNAYIFDTATDDIRIPVGYTLGSFTNISYDTWSATANNINSAIDSDASFVRRCYIGLTGDFVSGDIVIASFSSYNKISGTNPKVYIADPVGTAISNTLTLSASGEYVFTLTGSSTNGRLYIDSTPAANLVNFNCTLTRVDKFFYTKGYLLTEWTGYGLRDFLAGVLDSIGTSYTTSTIKSTFIFNDALPTNPPPTIATYMSTHSGYNYETETINKLNDLRLMGRDQLREITGAWLTGSTPFTFSDVMNWLGYYLPIFWYIDDDGNFRIESAYYFEDLHTTGIDLTSSTYTPFKPELSKYRNDKSNLCKKETFTNDYDLNVDFKGKPIIYSIYDTGTISVKDRKATLISTDFKYLYDNLIDSIAGYLLVQCVAVGSYHYVESENGILTGLPQVNGHMALANCHDKYWRHGRFSLSGNLNGSDVTFLSRIPTISGEVKFISTSDIDEYGNVITSFGTGIIDNLYRNDNDSIRISLKYTSY